ncbi:hypothetical protein HG536_0C01370 [Torulaspora globosa]|uniref:RING-type domain-containing protein n=1 Tax=Torulaspora globosa TaxID=48254 RepID=A0A7G3ZEN3_9SACH|nr:uncharacterized protein HG536_0C01370 [Torulaspora globosa]QLL31969.1 hypothetical protein HG536_0C01370 [Torulaspora globosa]
MTSPNDNQSLEPPNDDGNPPTPANEAGTGNGDRPTRSITVSIQYSYFNPNGLANLNRGNAGADNEETPPVARPDGALILSFRDVPTSTPQERLESIISIAAELAMRRFSDLMSQPKGISKEQFEELPTVRISELQDEQSKVCSICYDSYEEEPENILKRSRDEEFGDRSDLIKKQRSESPAVMIGAEEPAGNSGAHSSQGPNDGETPTYKHSPVRLPCDHVFGRECLFKWSQLENSCPLCRHKIVDAAPGNSGGSSENMANLNAEAFERIRQALYNTPQAETAEGGGSDTANEAGDTNEGNDLQNFTFSRSGIVLLRPDDLAGPNFGEQSNAAGQGQGAASEEASAATNSAFNPFAASNGENRRVQWIPLPITTIYTGANNLNTDGANNNSSGTNLDGSETSRHQERSPNERLRAILSNIFNVSHSANMARTNEDSGAPNASNNINTEQATSARVAPSTSDRQSSSNSPIPRRRSFLDHILRITNRHRNRPNNGIPRANTPTALHSANSMFNSGVASYRNQDGQVSTFNITDGQLPAPPQATQPEQGTTGANTSGSQTAHPRSDSGESSSESNDTSS